LGQEVEEDELGLGAKKVRDFYSHCLLFISKVKLWWKTF